MPFRARIKRALTRNSSSSSTPADSSRHDSNIYQPGEKMPTPKYRRPVAPEHKAMLDAFTFSTSCRRNSGVSQYSPMGSRMPSRRNSISDQPRRSYHTARQHPLGSSLVREGSASVESVMTDDGSLSSLPTNSSSRGLDSLSTSNTSNSSTSANQPWTQEELALALQRSNLAVPP